MSQRRPCALGIRLALLASLAAVPAGATQRFGPVQISGNLQSANIIRHPDERTFQFIMNRNIAHLRLDYDWLEGGKFYGKYRIPFIERSHLFLLWRGVYDSVYDTAPGFIQKDDVHGRAYNGHLNLYEYATRSKGFSRGVLQIRGMGHDAREGLKFENQLREAYADIKFRGIPLTVRAGRQQIVWGESDNFRMLDRVNTLDITWHFAQELPPPAYAWDEIRRPFWMFKFLYDLGDVWKLSQNFLEWYWNPGDWAPAKVDFLPRPWGLPLLHPLTNPVDGGFIGGLCATSRIKIRGGPNDGAGMCTQLMNGTELFKKGDYHRNPIDNSQVGVRYHAIAPFGLEFTLNYLYQRWGGDDGTNYAPIRGLPKNRINNDRAVNLEAAGIFPAEYITPYVHTLGVAGNYSDEVLTQSVFRFETIYDVGIPFFDLARVTTIDKPSVPGVRKKNMWKGMVAFDRPTWIRTLNKKSTVFLTGQFFWHHLVNNPSCDDPGSDISGAQALAGIPDPLVKARVLRRTKSCLVGGLDLPSIPRIGAASSPAFRDKIRDWESLFSLAAFTFYRGGSILPIAGLAVDWVNQWSMEPFWSLDYVVRDDFVVNVAQRYFVTPKGHSTPIFETWGLGGLNHGRSETEVRFTYQF
jgi:hypothetical protein